MISKIHIQNYKALRDVTLELTPFHVLIGPNDSGKTSILEAVGALCRLPGSEPEKLADAFVGSWAGKQLVWNSDPTAAVTLSGVISDNLAYKVEYHFSPTGRAFSLTHEFLYDAEENHEIGGRSREPSNMRDWRTQGGAPLEKSTLLKLAELAGVQCYRFDPRQLRMPAARDSERRFAMSQSGFGLPIFLEDLREANLDGYLILLKRFKEIFPQIKDIKSDPIPAPNKDPEWRNEMGQPAPHGWGKEIQFELVNSSRLIPASQISDGILLVLGYLAILHMPQPPRLLLVEEPETGIYPKLMQQVITILRDVVKGQSHTQVIMTTHSPDMLDQFEASEVTMCRKEKDGSVSVHPLSQSKAVKDQIDVFTLGEIWLGEDDKVLASEPQQAKEPAR